MYRLVVENYPRWAIYKDNKLVIDNLQGYYSSKELDSLKLLEKLLNDKDEEIARLHRLIAKHYD